MSERTHAGALSSARIRAARIRWARWTRAWPSQSSRGAARAIALRRGTEPQDEAFRLVNRAPVHCFSPALHGRQSLDLNSGVRGRYTASMRRVLIVEDEPAALELLVSWIQHQRGWEICSAHSGKSAIELSKTFKPDVVISDYLLDDDVTGVDVIAEVQSTRASVRCVLVTGVLRKATLDAQRINGVPILTKPLDFRRLSRLIAESAS